MDMTRAKVVVTDAVDPTIVLQVDFDPAAEEKLIWFIPDSDTLNLSGAAALDVAGARRVRDLINEFLGE